MTITNLIQETIAQHIIAPRVISYVASKLNEVQGRFVSSNRVYNFVLNTKGVSYSPAGQGDSLLFSALYLRMDGVRKPKVGNDKCNAGVSYQCGKICLGNRRKCHKGVRDVNDARRIASILEGTNRKLKADIPSQVSEKALAKGQRLRDNKVKGRALLEGSAKKRETINDTDLTALKPQLFSLDSDKIIKDATELNSQDLKKGQKIKLLQYAPSSDFGNPRYHEQSVVTVAEVSPSFIKVKFTNAGGQVVTNKHQLFDNGKWKDGTIHDGNSHPNAAMDLLQARKLSNIKSPTAEDRQKKREIYFRVNDHIEKLDIKSNSSRQIPDDTDALNRLEQLVKLGERSRDKKIAPDNWDASKRKREEKTRK